MLKRILVTVALIGVTAYSYGQGTVNFNTRVGTTGNLTVDRRAQLSTGGNPEGLTYFVQLYSAPGQNAPEASLTAAGTPVNFRTGSVGAGHVQTTGMTNRNGQIVNSTVVVTPVDGGAATVQIRAWDANFASYELAVLANPTLGHGKGAVINLSSTGGPDLDPPTVPVNLLGSEVYTIQVVPEPSTLALGALGLAALLFRRRK